jgi:hypothetical protein
MIKNITSSIEALKVNGAKITIDEKARLNKLEQRKNIEFNSMDSEFVYALSLIGSEFVQRFVGCWKKNEEVFFYQPTDWSIRFYYMHELPNLHQYDDIFWLNSTMLSTKGGNSISTAVLLSPVAYLIQHM